MSRTIALIDGDVLVYRAAFAVEQAIDWGDGMHTLCADENQAKQSIHGLLEEIQDDLKTKDYHIALTCHETVNFRKEFYPQYKENRKELRKPLVWKYLRDYMMDTYKAQTRPNIEADDILGIWATKKWPGNPKLIVASVDKDFKSIPCSYWNIKKKVMEELDEEKADYNFFKQILVGDNTDNYPGCKGVGPKRAASILDNSIRTARLDDHREATTSYMWKGVVLAFQRAGFGEEFALTQARCARILRACDYDFVNKKPILWRPPDAPTAYPGSSI